MGNKRYKTESRLIIARIIMMLAAMAACASAGSTIPDTSIQVGIAYGQTPGFDDNNDGVARFDSAIDFTVLPTTFSWNANQSHLCTLWRILPLDQSTASMTCYGDQSCCSISELVPGSANWNDTFILYSGTYGVSSAALVSAKVVYADFNITSGVPYSNIVYSDWGTLFGLFTSSDTAQTEIRVISPDNSTPLLQGENVSLMLTANIGDSVMYSLDGAQSITLPYNPQGNFTQTLSGRLPGNVIANGQHTITLYSFIGTPKNITSRLEHPFTVQDTSFPAISTNINNTALSSLNQTYSVHVSTDELANLSYKLNSGPAVMAGNLTRGLDLQLSPIQGSNTLSINASDMQGNSHSYFYRFNFAVNGTGTCSDAVQNYHNGVNETGIDCGGACAACIDFTVSTDKPSYTLGDLVYISVQARADALHNITITGPSYQTSFTYNGTTYYLLFPPAPGTYSINVSLAYRNLTPQYITKQFTVSQSATFSVTIQTNGSTLDSGGTVEFKSTVSGNASATSFRWDLNGDNVTDATSPTANYTYSAPGTYTINLTATDGTSVASSAVAITVKPFYNITIMVNDTANQTIPSALVRVKGTVSHATPFAYYRLTAGAYEIYINGSGYKDVTSTIYVTENQTFGFKLQPYYNSIPSLTLLNPPDGANINGQEATLSFQLQDETANNCAAYVSKSQKSWNRYGATYVNSGEHDINLSALENATYQWRIECTNQEGNVGTSETRTFYLHPLQPQSLATSQDYNSSDAESKVLELTAEINQILTRIESYGKLEQEAIETLKISSELDSDKTDLQRIIRDVRNVQWRKFNSSDEQEFLNGKLNDIEIIAQNITSDVKVTESAKFVSYPSETDIREAATTYVHSLGKNPVRSELDKYANENKAIQQSATITTDYKTVELTDNSGNTRTITLIQKSLDFSGDMSSLLLLETVPKEMARSTKDINALFDYDTIKQDPVISVKIPEAAGATDEKKYAYYIKGALSQTQAQKTTSILLKKNFTFFEGGGTGSVTGFAVFSGSSPLANPISRIIMEVILALTLAAAYFAYSKGMLFSGDAELSKITASIAQIRQGLQESNYAKLKMLYAETSASFKQLKPANRAEFFPVLSELRLDIDAVYVKSMISDATKLLVEGKRDEAQKTYQRLSIVYKSLPPKQKKEVFKACVELSGKLS